MNQKNRPAHDPLEELIEAFQRMSVPDRPCDGEVLGRLGTCRGGRAGPVSDCPPSKRPYLLRLLISSAAAALLLAGSLGLLVLNSTAPLAVADVVKAARKHKLVRYKQQQTVFNEENVSTCYADLTAQRLRSESHAKQPDGEPVFVSVQDSVRHLAIKSRQKTAWLGLTPKGFKSFCCSLEEFEQQKGVSQVQEKLGDLAAVKYCFKDGDQTSSLWVDAKTMLPVRMEQEVTGSGVKVVRNRFVWTDFEWDPELPKGFRNLDELFSTRPPEGYTLDDQTKDKKQK
jgi:outer membrane lipoprotein-sorting protein